MKAIERLAFLAVLWVCASLPLLAQSAPSVTIKWTASATAGVTYNLYRCTGAGCAPFNTASGATNTPLINTPQLQYTDSAVSTNTTYNYAVTAYCTTTCPVGVLGESAPTASVAAVIGAPTTPPNPPGTPSIVNITVQIYERTDERVKVAFSNTTGVEMKYTLLGPTGSVLAQGKKNKNTASGTITWTGNIIPSGTVQLCAGPAACVSQSIPAI